MLASVASGKNVRVITNDQMRDHAFQVNDRLVVKDRLW